MKTTILIAALIGAVALPTMTFAKTVAGCDVVLVAGTNYFNKADVTCKFNTPTGSRVYQEGESPLNPDDGDASTQNVVTVSDN